MSYTPMSDLGQQGLFDITRTLLQQPDLASLCEALSQLVKRSALADNAAIVLWQAQTQRASYYASCNQVNHLIPTRVLVKGGEITCKMLK
nr:transcriptional regulator [Escherichia coli]